MGIYPIKYGNQLVLQLLRYFSLTFKFSNSNRLQNIILNMHNCTTSYQKKQTEVLAAEDMTGKVLTLRRTGEALGTNTLAKSSFLDHNLK